MSIPVLSDSKGLRRHFVPRATPNLVLVTTFRRPQRPRPEAPPAKQEASKDAREPPFEALCLSQRAPQAEVDEHNGPNLASYLRC
jgi:hypothetical protein